MDYISRCPSPLGDILLGGDEGGLFGLWFVGQKYFAAGVREERREAELPVFDEARRWLERYFSGNDPGFVPALHLRGTDFQKRVWALLLAVPYGRTVAYGELAGELRREGRYTSPRAVGGAVGRNRVSLIVPCHRVVGADGSLTGYAGGLERKTALLALEKRTRTCTPSSKSP